MPAALRGTPAIPRPPGPPCGPLPGAPGLQTDGGCLALYNVPYSGPLRCAGLVAGEPATVVAPTGGRLLIFESHLFHEVLPAHRNRYD